MIKIVKIWSKENKLTLYKVEKSWERYIITYRERDKERERESGREGERDRDK